MSTTPSAPKEGQQTAILPDDFFHQATDICVEYARQYPVNIARGLCGTVIENTCIEHAELLTKTIKAQQAAHAQLVARCAELEAALKEAQRNIVRLRDAPLSLEKCIAEGALDRIKQALTPKPEPKG